MLVISKSLRFTTHTAVPYLSMRQCPINDTRDACDHCMSIKRSHVSILIKAKCVLVCEWELMRAFY